MGKDLNGKELGEGFRQKKNGTYSARCFESGISAKTVQAYLGHASIKMTMDLYTHVMDDQKQSEMEKE